MGEFWPDIGYIYVLLKHVVYAEGFDCMNDGEVEEILVVVQIYLWLERGQPGNALVPLPEWRQDSWGLPNSRPFP